MKAIKVNSTTGCSTLAICGHYKGDRFIGGKTIPQLATVAMPELSESAQMEAFHSGTLKDVRGELGFMQSDGGARISYATQRASSKSFTSSKGITDGLTFVSLHGIIFNEGMIPIVRLNVTTTAPYLYTVATSSIEEDTSLSDSVIEILYETDLYFYVLVQLCPKDCVSASSGNGRINNKGDSAFGRLRKDVFTLETFCVGTFDMQHVGVLPQTFAVASDRGMPAFIVQSDWITYFNGSFFDGGANPDTSTFGPFKSRNDQETYEGYTGASTNSTLYKQGSNMWMFALDEANELSTVENSRPIKVRFIHKLGAGVTGNKGSSSSYDLFPFQVAHIIQDPSMYDDISNGFAFIAPVSETLDWTNSGDFTHTYSWEPHLMYYDMSTDTVLDKGSINPGSEYSNIVYSGNSVSTISDMFVSFVAGRVWKSNGEVNLIAYGAGTYEHTNAIGSSYDNSVTDLPAVKVNIPYTGQYDQGLVGSSVLTGFSDASFTPHFTHLWEDGSVLAFNAASDSSASEDKGLSVVKSITGSTVEVSTMEDSISSTGHKRGIRGCSITGTEAFVSLQSSSMYLISNTSVDCNIALSLNGSNDVVLTVTPSTSNQVRVVIKLVGATYLGESNLNILATGETNFILNAFANVSAYLALCEEV